MKGRVAAPLLLCILAAACVAAPSPSPSAGRSVLVANYVRQSIVVDVDGVRLGAVACGEITHFFPGPEVPPFPWDVALATASRSRIGTGRIDEQGTQGVVVSGTLEVPVFHWFVGSTMPSPAPVTPPCPG